jgi:acyl dehydratase
VAIPLVIPDVASLKRFVGTELGPSDWVTVTQKRIDLFADATDDHQWIHVDPERAARESPFAGTVAHGYLTLSMAYVLLPGPARGAGGDDAQLRPREARLHAPVRAGARIRFHATIQSVRHIGGGPRRARHRSRWRASPPRGGAAGRLRAPQARRLTRSAPRV